MDKDLIKEVVAGILYIDDYKSIEDDISLFTELQLSSIDYIDLCFELKNKFNKNITQDNLWPINKLMLDEKMFNESEWTQDGWSEVCSILNIDKKTEKTQVRDLYKYFTVNYIEATMKTL